MKKKRMFIEKIKETNLCSGCGACYAVCPYDAIGMKVSIDGAYRPFIEFSKCNYCGLCERVCPSLFPTRKVMINGLGRIISCYVGYSTDANIRWEASSGGLATTILLSLLEEGMIDGAVVVKDDLKNPIGPLLVFVKSKEEIKRAMGSKYCPVKPCFKVKDLVNEHGKIAVIGLPCHIWAFRKLEEVNGALRRKILIHIGLFCGKSPNFYATTYFIRKVADLYEKNIARISYRGRGWPGNIIIETKQGCSRTLDYHNWINFSYYPHFIPVRCALCYDITNQLADLSLGDAWGLTHDQIGTSVIITRTRVGESVLKRLHSYGKVVLREVSPEHISKGQGLASKLRNSLIRAYIWRKIFHQPTPFTTLTLPRLSTKDWVFNLGYCAWLYATQNRSIRIILCNLTPYISKVTKLIRRKI